MRFDEVRASLWLSVAYCVARSVIVVAGKFASILICGLDSTCVVTHSYNLFFCVFSGQGFFELTKKGKTRWTVCGEEYFVAVLVLCFGHF